LLIGHSSSPVAICGKDTAPSWPIEGEAGRNRQRRSRANALSIDGDDARHAVRPIHLQFKGLKGMWTRRPSMDEAGSNWVRSRRDRDALLVQAQLAAAIREALKATVAEPLPFTLRLLLDRLAARERGARASKPRPP
jgi:hypothetical protein